ncbi:putative 2OG-Fe(II) oxygenase [Candidatus Thiodictyon syntrophicum]|jgi:uncharacterized protein (TIGR02466 family)|uniref:Fe2OG dioxygenase domain-containing protein n=1 Tax=Candidatus Thiodictyon syntrophicum TaxID=1166950 RepID=A0A2K8UDR2_9GAMM|nr:putative 2OG-Fe(II) oxygenase [Candidatus Thiodictyon syntrophicum]AUB83734.1 hypothetical protein THSYN_24110 [Candidatus Thiodictyon syntrophicum]
MTNPGTTATGTPAAGQAQFAMAFGTPIASRLWPQAAGLNAALAALVRDLAAAAPGGGACWQGGADLFARDAACLRTLADQARQMATGLTRTLLADPAQAEVGFRLTGWANLIRPGGYLGVHHHGGATWSGVYFVTAATTGPGPLEQGRLELLDPRPGVRLSGLPGTVLDGRCLIEPIPGLMVLFPGWLTHLVHPFQGAGERISIAFNLAAVPSSSAGPASAGAPDFGT